MKPKYSGKKSKKFWDKIHDIKNDSDKQELYSLGVVLQNLETYVIKQLKNTKP